MNNRYRHRQRVDWDEEIKKTERIKRRGIIMSVISFCAAIAFIFGINRFAGHGNLEIPKSVLAAAFFIVSCLILRAIIKHRQRKNNNNDNADSEI